MCKWINSLTAWPLFQIEFPLCLFLSNHVYPRAKFCESVSIAMQYF